MRGGALPPALLFAALGMALAFAPRRIRFWAALAAAAPALLMSFVPFSQQWADPLFLGCWITVLASAGSVHRPGGLGPRLAMLLALNVGVWAGAVVGVAGKPIDLAVSLPCILLSLPGGWLVATKRPIVVKIFSSWLIAIALLSATLQVTTPTPGYVPDHMD